MKLRSLVASATLLLSCFSSAFAAPDPLSPLGQPPEIEASARREGTVIIVTGTVTDENPETVQLTIGTSGPLAIQASIVKPDGTFRLELSAPFFEDLVDISALDEEGLTDSITVTAE